MVILETQRLLFRDHAPEDLGPFCAMQSDPESLSSIRVLQKLGFAWVRRDEGEHIVFDEYELMKPVGT